MPRIFYTERDIEDLARRGVHEIDVNEDVYLTDLARERMEALGIRAKGAGPGATPSTPAAASSASQTGGLSAAEKQQVIEKVKAGVIARLGPGVDTAMVDTIVRRVVGQL